MSKIRGKSEARRFLFRYAAACLQRASDNGADHIHNRNNEEETNEMLEQLPYVVNYLLKLGQEKQ